VHGAGGTGSGAGWAEGVLEVLVRAAGGGAGRRGGVERVLEGWSRARGGACALDAVESLRGVFARNAAEQVRVAAVFCSLRAVLSSILWPGARPAAEMDVPFNVGLTGRQQAARAQVPLPYAHQGAIWSSPRLARASPRWDRSSDLRACLLSCRIGARDAVPAAAAAAAILYDPDSADDIDDDDPDDDLDI